jgi:hypothetical protein
MRYPIEIAGTRTVAGVPGTKVAASEDLLRNAKGDEVLVVDVVVVVDSERVLAYMFPMCTCPHVGYSNKLKHTNLVWHCRLEAAIPV